MENFIDRYCVYFKNTSVCLGRLDSYIIDEKGLELTLHCQEAGGLPQFPSELSLYGVWPDLSVMKKQITCFQEGWHLFFDEKLIGDIMEISSSTHGREDHLMQSMDRILNYLAGENDK